MSIEELVSRKEMCLEEKCVRRRNESREVMS